jgi:RNA polymerase sigma-70 factor (ECF subfamily)
LDAQLTARCYHGAIVASFVDPVDLKPRPDPDPISVSDLAATYENGMRFVFVLIGVMLATASDGAIASLEAVLANGDEAAERFLRLAEGELDRAYRLAGLILGDRREAEDATQDALLRAWRSAASVRDPAGFQAWFDRILVNVCRDRIRQRGRVRLIAMDDAISAEMTRDPFRGIADRDGVLWAMAALEDDLRIVILLHYWADLTLDGVAERVGWPVGTVKSRLHRGLAAMRGRLNAAAFGETPR